MDAVRARQIIKSPQSIPVLYQDTPVWLENVNDNNTADVTRMDRKDRINVPVYLLVEK